MGLGEEDPGLVKINKELRKGYTEMKAKKNKVDQLRRQLFKEEDEGKEGTGKKKNPSTAAKHETYENIRSKTPPFIKIKAIKDNIVYHDNEIRFLKAKGDLLLADNQKLKEQLETSKNN